MDRLCEDCVFGDVEGKTTFPPNLATGMIEITVKGHEPWRRAVCHPHAEQRTEYVKTKRAELGLSAPVIL